jgi:hypothetical protein
MKSPERTRTLLPEKFRQDDGAFEFFSVVLEDNDFVAGFEHGRNISCLGLAVQKTDKFRNGTTKSIYVQSTRRCASRPTSRSVSTVSSTPKQQIEASVPVRLTPLFHASFSRRPYVSPNVSFARELISEVFGSVILVAPFLQSGAGVLLRSAANNHIQADAVIEKPKS